MNLPQPSTPRPSPGLSAFSAERPLLLLVDYPADTPGGGAEVIRSLLDEEDQAKIIWVTPQATPAKLPGRWRGQAMLCPDALPGNRDVALGTGLNPGLARKMADRLAELAAHENAAGVWIIMHGACVFIAAQFLQAHRLPTHLSVHDDPVNYTLLSRRRFFLAPLMARAFSFALHRASSVDVISAGMTKMYVERYGIAAPHCHRGVNISLPRPIGNVAAGELSIGILGNTYGSGNVVVLAEAAMLAAARLSVKARLVLIGQPQAGYLKARFGEAVAIEALPYAGEAEAVEQLSKCFLLYLTYPFARLYRTLRRSSFPTKLSTYGRAARPLLLHAPADSQIMQIAADSTYAAAWTDRTPRNGSEVISKFWQGSVGRDDFRAAAAELLDTYFNREKNRGVLFDRLNSLPA